MFKQHMLMNDLIFHTNNPPPPLHKSMVCSESEMTPRLLLTLFKANTLTLTGHFGSPSVTVQPTSAAKPCTEPRTRECDPWANRYRSN